MSDYKGVFVFMEKIKRGDDRVDVEQLEFKKVADPHGRSNPGKMRAWWEESQGETRKEGALYPVREGGKVFKG